MTHDPVSVVVTDPRTFDGDPYEVAGRSVRQFAGMVMLLRGMIGPMERMVRNSEMERAFDFGNIPEPTDWTGSPLERKIRQIETTLTDISGVLGQIERAAEFAPKDPIPEED